MKILQITPYYLPHIGGLERYVYNLSQYLLSKGHSVSILTTDIPNLPIDEIKEGVAVHRYPFKIAPMGNPLVFEIKDLKSRVKQYDIVHLHGVYEFFTLLVSFILRKSKQENQRVLLTHHGRVVYPGSPKNLFVKLYEIIFVRFVLTQIDTAIVLSQSDKEHLVSLGMQESKIQVIPNGINLSLFVRPNEKILEKFREKYSLAGKKVILFLAVISKRKGIFDLLQAFQQLNDKDAVLLIVGDGPDREKAIRLAKKLKIADRIVSTGKISFESLLCAYSVADVYVLPSYFEGMPTTILEALALGTPVVATRIPGIKDNFADYIELVDAGNIVELKEKIGTSLTKNNKNQVVECTTHPEFDIESAFDKYNYIYSAPTDV